MMLHEYVSDRIFLDSDDVTQPPGTTQRPVDFFFLTKTFFRVFCSTEGTVAHLNVRHAEISYPNYSKSTWQSLCKSSVENRSCSGFVYRFGFNHIHIPDRYDWAFVFWLSLNQGLRQVSKLDAILDVTSWDTKNLGVEVLGWRLQVEKIVVSTAQKENTPVNYCRDIQIERNRQVFRCLPWFTSLWDKLTGGK